MRNAENEVFSPSNNARNISNLNRNQQNFLSEERNPLIIEESRIEIEDRGNFNNNQIPNENMLIINRQNFEPATYLKSRHIKEFLKDFFPAFINVL